MKRVFKLEELDKYLEIKEATKLNIDKFILQIEETIPNYFRLTFSKLFTNDFTKLNKIIIKDKKILFNGLDYEADFIGFHKINYDFKCLYFEKDKKSNKIKILYSGYENIEKLQNISIIHSGKKYRLN